MHFQNPRRSIIKNKKSTKPCPYHSRVSSTVDQQVKSKRAPYSMDKTPKESRNFSPHEQQIKLPKIIKSQRNQKTIKVTESRIAKTQPTFQPLIDPEINIDIDYYQDLKLQNEGWPSNAYFGKVYHARQDDALTKAQNRVKQIYQDEYHNIRDQLQTINRIKQRYLILQNIDKDKAHLKIKLKKLKNKATLTQTEADLSESQNQAKTNLKNL